MTTTTATPDKDCPRPARYKHGTAGAWRCGCRCRAAARARKAARIREHRGEPSLNPMVPAHGLLRRMRALLAMGHDDSYVAERLGWSRRTPPALRHRAAAGHFVYEATHRQIDQLYRELSAVPGRSARVRRGALTAGYAPPIAWDGVDIDDPAAEPDMTGVLGAKEIRRDRTRELGRSGRAAGRIDIDDLVATYRAGGRTVEDLARTHGRKVSTIISYLERAGVYTVSRHALKDAA